MSKILITGGCGFLGSNVAHHFLTRGDELVIVDALFRRGAEANLIWLQSIAKKNQISFYQIDTADNKAFGECLSREKGFDYVCHFAGQVAMTTSLDDPLRDFHTNATGSLNLLEGVRKYSPNALVAFSSTNKVYGDLEYIRLAENKTRYTAPDYPLGFDETLPLDFASPYGCSKGSADQYFRDWYRNFGLRTVVFRHSSIYGGRQFATYDQGWIGWFCFKALEQKQLKDEGVNGDAFTISGSGKQVRDVLHSDDLSKLYAMASENSAALAGNIYNIGGGMRNSMSLLELFALLESKLEYDGQIIYEKLPRRKSDQDFFVADIAKIRNAIGWEPLVSAEKGIERMIEWSRAVLKQETM
jgi:CDP-paratose 2-epimerase